MSHTQTILQTCHKLVWDFRDRMADRWPTPTRRDALRFALTEAGEVVDAILRQNPTYNRNHAKAPNVYDELADTAIMLLSADREAPGPAVTTPNDFVRNREAWPEILSYYIGQAAWQDTFDQRLGSAHCLAALSYIVFWPGLDALPGRIAARLARIEARIANQA